MVIEAKNPNYNIAGTQTELEPVDAPEECACGCGDEACECGCDEEELYEIEFDEDDVSYWIEDEEGNRIGFAINEDGEDVEYFFAEDEVEEVAASTPAAKPAAKKKEQTAFQMMREDAGKAADKLKSKLPTEDQVATGAAKAASVAKEGVEAAKEVKDAFAEIKDAFDFRNLLK